MTLMNGESVDAFVTRVLHGLLAGSGTTQIFLFGPAGDPFWCARKPIPRDELRLLEAALDLIERTEASRPKPFVGHDSAGRFAVAALGGDSDLYVVRLNAELEGLGAEARVLELRQELSKSLQAVRNATKRAKL